MADYIGMATGKQLDALPNKVSQLEQKVGELWNTNAKTLLQTILSNAVYVQDQTSNITSLINAIGATSSSGGSSSGGSSDSGSSSGGTETGGSETSGSSLLNVMNPLTIGKTASAAGTSRPNVTDGGTNRACTQIVDISSLASSLGTITITAKGSSQFACYFGNNGEKDNITTWAFNTTLTLDISSCTHALFLITNPTSTDLNDHLTIS